jgi:hypothetical protein
MRLNWFREGNNEFFYKKKGRGRNTFNIGLFGASNHILWKAHKQAQQLEVTIGEDNEK